MSSRSFDFVSYLLFMLLCLSCSFIIDSDLEQGYPCDDVQPRCLPGYGCQDGVCVPEPHDPSYDHCGGACGDGERCDRVTGTCVPFCQGVVCGTGDVCEPDSGRCRAAFEGVGALCRSDADCLDVLPGCSRDSVDAAGLHCACTMPASHVMDELSMGICLGFPVDPDDCSPCGETRCIRAELSSLGHEGTSAQRAVCVPEGFALCNGSEECLVSDTKTVCTYFGRPTDSMTSGWPEGFFSACASPSWDAEFGMGDECEPEQPYSCETGLCVPTEMDAHVCTIPCEGDESCGGMLADCVETVVSLATKDFEYWDIFRVCGQGPTLGRACDPEDPTTPCGTDAPLCMTFEDETMLCSRKCRKDSDCGLEGLKCQHSNDVEGGGSVRKCNAK